LAPFFAAAVGAAFLGCASAAAGARIKLEARRQMVASRVRMDRVLAIWRVEGER
jgi:hypothetical protein